jgi:hypothetical protein
LGVFFRSFFEAGRLDAFLAERAFFLAIRRILLSIPGISNPPKGTITATASYDKKPRFELGTFPRSARSTTAQCDAHGWCIDVTLPHADQLARGISRIALDPPAVFAYFLPPL